MTSNTHAPLEHFSFQIRRVLLPVRRVPNLEFRIAALALDRVVGSQRAAGASYIMVRLSFVYAR